MLFLFPYKIILLSIIVIPEIVFLFKPANLHKSEINEDVFQWKMIKDFGQKYGVKYWVLHSTISDDSSWKRWWYFLMKDRTLIGYFHSNTISSKINSDSERRLMNSTQANVVTLHIHLQKEIENLNNVVKSELKFDLNSNPKLINANSIWLVRVPKNFKPRDVLDIFDSVKMENENRVFFFTIDKKGQSELYEVYKIHGNGKTMLKNVGEWNPIEGFHNIQKENLKNYRSLEGIHIRAVSAWSPPFVTHLEDNCTSKECFRGIFADVWHTLAKQMNFTFTIRRAYLWGTLSNGTWNGMVGMLKEKIVDIAVADLTITNERSRVVDYLPSLVQYTEGLYMKYPGDAFSSVVYIRPFTKASWICIFVWLGITPLFLAIILRLGDSKKEKMLSILYCFTFAFSSVLNHGSMSVLKQTQSRLAFSSILIGGVLLSYHYAADLISHLAVRKIDFPLKSLDELSQKKEFKFIVPKGTAYLDYFRYSKDPTYIKIWKEKLEPYLDDLPLYNELEDSILNDPYSVTYAESMVKMTPAFIQCKIVNVGDPIRTAQLAYATQKHSPLHNAFEYQIKTMKEVGNIQRAIKRHQMTSQFCEDYSGKPISMNQCYTAYQLLSIGILLSFLSFILEVLFRPKIMNLLCNSGKQNVIIVDERKRTRSEEGKAVIGRYSMQMIGARQDRKLLNLNKDELYKIIIEKEDKINQMEQSINVLRRQILMLMVQKATYEARKKKFDKIFQIH